MVNCLGLNVQKFAIALMLVANLPTESGKSKPAMLPKSLFPLSVASVVTHSLLKVVKLVSVAPVVSKPLTGNVLMSVKGIINIVS